MPEKTDNNPMENRREGELADSELGEVSGGAARPMESLSLNYSKVEYEYTPKTTQSSSEGGTVTLTDSTISGNMPD